MGKIVLLMIILLILFSSCSEEKQVNANDTTTTAKQDEIDSTDVTTHASIIRDMHSDKNYEGKEFRILAISPGKHFYYKARDEENEIYFAEEQGDILYDSIYRRNMLTEELLNIKIVPVWGGETGDITTKSRQSILAADNEFDVCFNRLDFNLNLSAEKLMLNLHDIDTFDLYSPWWDQNVVSNFTMFNDTLYTISGDINFYDDYASSPTFFNHRIMAEMGYDFPYQNVFDGTWTIDMMIDMVKETTRDLNGDGLITVDNDMWGFAEGSHAILHYIYACGETMAHIDEKGELQITYNEKLVNVIEKLYEFFNTSKTVAIGGTYGSIFREGRKLFFMDMLGSISSLRDMEDDFGVLPMPKWDEKQERYTGYVSNGWTTSFSIPVTNLEPEISAIILDTMCAFSTETVTEAIYDIMLAEKLIRDVESQEMLPLVFASKVYDWAGDLAWAGPLRGIYEGLLTSNSNNFTSQFESKIESINAARDKLMESYRPQ